MLIQPAGKLKWPASTSTDVVGYIVYREIGAVPGYASPSANVGLQTEVALPLPGLDPIESDEVYYGVAAVDHVGNQSDITSIKTAIDVTPPAAPASLEHIRE